LGKVTKGIKCSVAGCSKDAVRSLSAERVLSAGLKVGSERRAYLCKEHYKEFKKATKEKQKLRQWRYKG
jgi:hypothetical protein